MAEDVAYMAVKSIGLSTVGGRRPCTLRDAARHNLREIQAEMGAACHIDPARSRANIILSGPKTAQDVQGAAALLLAKVGPLRRDHCQALEFVFSLPVGGAIDVVDYFTKCLGWLEAELKLPVLSAVVHCDESAPHMHTLLLPLNREGRHVGGAPIGYRSLPRLRASFFDRVAGRAGLKREGAKMRGQAKGWAIAAILQRCEAMDMPTACGPLWLVLKAAIERDPVAALTALEIDPNTIRETVQDAQAKMGRTDAAQTPIGFEGAVQNPTGIEKEGQEFRSLSCVGIAHSSPAETTTEPVAQRLPEQQSIGTLVELWERVGRLSAWRLCSAATAASAHGPQRRKVARTADRIAAGRQAIRHAMARGGGGAAKVAEDRAASQPQGAVGSDEWTRDRDGVCDPEPWADW